MDSLHTDNNNWEYSEDMLKKFIFLLVVFFVIFCARENYASPEAKIEANKEDTRTLESLEQQVPAVDKQASTYLADWNIIQGVKAGKLQAGWTLDDIVNNFAKTEYSFTEIYIGEGEIEDGLILFPNTNNELDVRFYGKEKKISMVSTCNSQSNWVTKQGVKVGTSMLEIENINGRVFTILGWGWDYGGQMFSNNDGLYKGPKLWFSRNVSVSGNEFDGDREISSSSIPDRNTIKVGCMDVSLRKDTVKQASAFSELTVHNDKRGTISVRDVGDTLFSVTFDLSKDFSKREEGAAYGAGYKRIDRAFIFANCLIVTDMEWFAAAHSGGLTKINIYDLDGNEKQKNIVLPLPLMTGKRILATDNSWGIIFSEAEGDIYGAAMIDDKCQLSNYLFRPVIYSYYDFKVVPEKNLITVEGNGLHQQGLHKYIMNRDGTISYQQMQTSKK